MENDKKEERFQRDQPETNYASSTNNLPNDLGETIKAFEKSLEGLENIIKLLKSDITAICKKNKPSNLFFLRSIICSHTQSYAHDHN